jgi:hypothetical protein
LLSIAAVTAAAFVLYAGRDIGFHYDEWDFVLGRRGLSADTLLEGHNGHLSVLPVIYYKVMLQVVGLEHHWVLRVVLAGAHAAVGVLVYALLRPRTGNSGGLIGAVLVLFLGAAWENLVWAFQIGFVGSVLFGLGALLALDRRTRRANVVAAACLAAALGCSSVGVPFVIAAAVELALDRRWRRLMLVIGPPVLLYGLWYVGWGGSDISASNLSAAPPYVFTMAASAAAGLAGLSGTEAGAALALLAVGALVLLTTDRTPSPRFAGLLAAALALWVLTALARAQYAEAGASRYVYPSAVLLVLLFGEAFAGLRVPRSSRVAVAALVALAAGGGLAALERGAGGLRTLTTAAAPRLAALEIAGVSAAPGYQPDPGREPQVTAGPYLSAVAEFGSPSLSEAELVAANPEQRAAADQVLREVVGPALSLAPAGRIDFTTCRVLSSGGQTAVTAAGVTILPASRDAIAVRIRRYGDTPVGDPVATVSRATRLVFPSDRGSRPWFAQLTGRRPARVCD